MSLPAPPRLPTGQIRHIEIWDDVECNSGARMGFIARNDCHVIEEYIELAQREEFTIRLDPETAIWSEIDFKRVLRPVYFDDSYAEYRISEIGGARSGSSDFTRYVLALGIKNDLQLNSTLLTWPQVNGLVLLHHELIDVSIDVVVDALLATNDIPAYITKGTIEGSGLSIDNINDWETPLSALEEVARVSGTEFRLRRNGSTDYQIDLLDEYNSAAEKPIIEYRKNQLSARMSRDVMNMATRIYPRGEGPQGAAPHIGDCLFWATALTGPPSDTYYLAHVHTASAEMLMVTEDDQWNGLYLEDMEGNHYLINDSYPAFLSAPTWRMGVTLSSSVDIDGKLVWLRADNASEQVVSLSSPTAIATYGEIPMVLERLDLPGVNNLMPDPFGEGLSKWVANSGTATRVGRPNSLVHYGDYTWKYEGDTDETMRCNDFLLQGDKQPISARYTNLSFQILVYVEAGKVEFYVEGFTATPSVAPHADFPRYPPLAEDGVSYQIDGTTGEPVRAATAAVGAWYHLTLEPQLYNFYDFRQGASPLDEIDFVIKALEDSTVIYVSATQIVNRNVVAEKFVAGSNYARLYDSAMRAFVNGVNEPKLTLDVEALDLNRLDATTWPYDSIDVGVTCVLRDAGLDFDVERRVFSVKRDLLREAVTDVEFVEP